MPAPGMQDRALPEWVPHGPRGDPFHGDRVAAAFRGRDNADDEGRDMYGDERDWVPDYVFRHCRSQGWVPREIAYKRPDDWPNALPEYPEAHVRASLEWHAMEAMAQSELSFRDYMGERGFDVEKDPDVRDDPTDRDVHWSEINTGMLYESPRAADSKPATRRRP